VTAGAASATRLTSGDALNLTESGFPLQEGVLQPDGTVLIHIIRPGVGRGRGRHYYSPDVLRESAPKWAGVKMFANHLSRKAREALEGLPRPIEHLGGRIIESWWDENVPADDRFEQGAVVGKVKPTSMIRRLIEDDPELVETSINARATAVQVGTQKGQRVHVVEGIQEAEGKIAGSVDWVTDAGAGGKVVQMLTEGSYSEEDMEADLLAGLTNDEITSFLRENRPELIEALSGSQGNGNGDGGTTPPEEDDQVEITPDALREALTDPENAKVLSEIVDPLVEAKVEERSEEIIREASAELRREVQLRDLQEAAHEQIDEAKLPPLFAEKAKGRFAVKGGSPTALLDVWPDVDSDGNTVKSAEDKLTEAVEEVVSEMRELAGSVRPTLVRGQGAHGAVRDGGGEGGGSGDEDKNRRVDSELRESFEQAGFSKEEIDGMYGEPLTGVVG
jgi:hypothetical protein